jgi:hypothetical protein
MRLQNYINRNRTNYYYPLLHELHISQQRLMLKTFKYIISKELNICNKKENRMHHVNLSIFFGKIMLISFKQQKQS